MAKKEFSFADAAREIEAILERIEGGEPDIDKLSAEVRRASELLVKCREKLRNTEEEINKIFRENV